MIPFFQNNTVVFPDISNALSEPNGLLAAGGNLSPETLLKAYRLGIFPWYSPPDPILWWSPDPRSVLKPNHLHISHSLKKCLKKNAFVVTCDKAFIDVMQGCAGPRNYTNDTWISNDIINGYYQLHKNGFAHSIEVWQDNKLVGGLYGVAIGCMFYGESMFSRVANASKVGFVHLVQALAQCGFELVDCQVRSQHLDSLGAQEMKRDEFQSLINELTNKTPTGSPWDMLNS